MGRSLLLVLLCSSLISCGTVGMMVSPTKQYVGQDTITLGKSSQNYLDKAAEVGKSLGYSVSSLDRPKNKIGFSKDAGLFIGVMIGKIERADVMLEFTGNGQSVDIRVFVMGNFDTGGQEAATEILDRFKSGLTRSLGSG